MADLLRARRKWCNRARIVARFPDLGTVYSRLLDGRMGAKYFGAAVRRREDPRFLRGEGRYVDDVTLPGMLHAAFLRSPHAHARIAALRTDAARALPGVAAVFTFADLERWMKPLPLFGAVPPGLAAAIAFDVRQAPQYALCRDRAVYVGEIVAMVVAESPARAADALERIEVDWEPLPAVVDNSLANCPRILSASPVSPSATNKRARNSLGSNVSCVRRTIFLEAPAFCRLSLPTYCVSCSSQTPASAKRFS